jgi:signal transduction histidine kinase
MDRMTRRGAVLDLIVLLLVSVAAAAALAAVLLPQYPGRYTAAVLVVPVASAVAVGIRELRLRLRDSAERLRRAATEHKAATRRAVEAERARIAAELHDVVTHHVSMMVVQAGAARTVLQAARAGAGSGSGEPGADAAEALRAIEASGRTAISELRAMLGLLGADGADGSADGGRAPQPGLSDLDALIGRVSAAGLSVELHVTGTPHPLPPGAELAVYRVVQESLTNVMRHARGESRTSVRMSWGEDLVITVTDDGRGGDGEPGRGLLGLRERLALYGGELDAGPLPGGGWRVRAMIAA